MYSITLTKEHDDQRFDRLLRKIFKKYRIIGLSAIFSWIRTGKIMLNNKRSKPEKKVRHGDTVTFLNIEEIENLTGAKLDTELGIKNSKPEINFKEVAKHVLFENDSRIIWNKPAGLVMHEGNEHYRDITMNDWLEQYLGYKEDKTVIDTFKPSFCYRLDRDTSGVLVSAKNYEALKYLNKLIQDRGGITKRYHAICIGKPIAQKIDKPLFKGFNAKFERAQTFVNHEKGLEAVSLIKPLKTITHEKLGVISLVEVEIKTGRMHQIRVHLASIGYPIIGDIMYGDEKTNRIAGNLGITRQLLHASHYRFLDHHSKEVVGDSPLPEEMVNLMKG